MKPANSYEIEDVPHLRSADVRRTDEVFDEVRKGPSLRLVIEVGDVEKMLAHALWVGQVRGGGRLPRPS